jgi:cytochrome c-type biogenesis protein CcmH/NrfG
MNKAQVLVAGAALAAIVGLGLLPKVVVNNSNRQLAEDKPDAPVRAGDSLVARHQATFTPAQASRLVSLRANLAQAKGAAAQRTALDSLLAGYRAVNLYDSAAHLAGQFADSAPTVSNLVLAGDAYSEAFTFSMDGEKSKALSLQAQEYYKKVLEKDPSRPDVRVKLGMTYVASPNPMEGIKIIRGVLEEDPDNQFALLNLGLLSMQSGQFDKAKARFEQLLNLNPTDAKAQFYLAVCLAELGKKNEAIQLFEQVKANQADPALQKSIDDYLQQLRQK